MQFVHHLPQKLILCSSLFFILAMFKYSVLLFLVQSQLHEDGIRVSYSSYMLVERCIGLDA